MVGNMLRDWINHTKEGPPRTSKQLKQMNDFCLKMIHEIKNIEKRNSLNEEDLFIVSRVKYVGKLTRFHQKFKSEYPFGVLSNNHFLSWTTQEDLSQIYWINNSKKYLFITAEATEDNFGISLIGLQDYLDKYHYKSYSLGSPAILKEKEVLFPLCLETISSMEIESINERNKKAGQSN